MSIISIRNGSGEFIEIPCLKGENGSPGTPGRDGVDGRTPVAGVDYYTAAEKTQMETDVASAVSTEITQMLPSKIQEQTYTKAEIDTKDATKVGYSEVENGQLKMYSDSSKTVLLATLDLPTTDLTDYVKNTDYATGYGGSAGIVNAWGDYGLTVSQNGRLQIASANYANIDGRNSSYRPITPTYLPYAVRSALGADVSEVIYDDSQRLNAQKRLGILKDWVLKGTITMDNINDGATVDLSNCTEVKIVSHTVSTATSYLFANRTGDQNIINNIAQNGTYNYIGIFEKTDSGALCTVLTRGSNWTQMIPINQGYSWNNGFTLDRITKFYLYSNISSITECEIKIYAR